MCTLSWHVAGPSYDVFFNRDERRTRSTATPPREFSAGSLQAIAPRDGDFNGTWIGVNQRGVTLALLNRYQDAEHFEPQEPVTSRGLLVLDLLDAESLQAVTQRVEAAAHNVFRPYTLIAFAPQSPPRMWEWNGDLLSSRELGEADLPVTSSSFEFPSVSDYRRELFRKMADGHDFASESLLRYHRFHDSEHPAHSPAMARPDALSLSLTWVHVDERRVWMRYADGPPHETDLGETVEIALDV